MTAVATLTHVCMGYGRPQTAYSAATNVTSLGYGRPQTAYSAATKVTKVKDLALIFRSVSLTQ